MKKNDYNGYAMALTPSGLIFYCFDTKETTMEEFMDIENIAYGVAVKNKYRLFKLYDTDHYGHTVVGIN
jgi:hypothetical protein